MSSFWNAPAWSMAKRSQSAKLKKDTTVYPGPGNYNSTLKIGQKNPGWKIGTSNRNQGHTLDVPGPGQYNSNLGKTGPKLTIGSKSKAFFHDQNQPGPGNYNVNDNAVLKTYSGYTMGSKYN